MSHEKERIIQDWKAEHDNSAPKCGTIFARMEKPADDKTAIAIGRGLRHWYSSLFRRESG